MVQFDEEASQTCDHCVAKSATHSARFACSGQAATRGSLRFLTEQRTLVRNDNQTALLPSFDLTFESWRSTHTILGYFAAILVVAAPFPGLRAYPKVR